MHKTVVKEGEPVVETSVAPVVAVKADAEKLETTVGVGAALLALTALNKGVDKERFCTVKAECPENLGLG